MSWRTLLVAIATTFALVCLGGRAEAAGTLKDSQTGQYTKIIDHRVRVVLNNGFARTEVTQVFANPYSVAIDAIYEFPIPKDAALSQMKIELADRTMNGKVLPRAEAEKIYADKKQAGSQAGLATKDGHQNFRFSIANIPAASEATMTFVYFEPLKIDESMGRYLYPLQDGGTSNPPWSGNQLAASLSFDLELESALPVVEVSMPGLTPTITKLGAGRFTVSAKFSPTELDQDLVFLYRFPSDLERRLEVVRHRKAPGTQGTFMAILTPGVDLAPITVGTDYVFVLDVSGSMQSKIATEIAAAMDALSKLKKGDRFRIIAFNENWTDVSGGFQTVTSSSISMAKTQVAALAAGGATDIYAALGAALQGLDADRVASVLLFTDAETNTGVIDAVAFDKLARQTDVRIFGMLMGNNANWPLLQVVSDASGGFFDEVSNQDDIALRVQQAFEKATHEALYDVKLQVGAAGLSELTDFRLTKVYKGQQLILFGRYDQPGLAEFTLEGKASGKLWTSTKTAALPEVEVENEEIVQLWALDMVHALERQRLLGLIGSDEAKAKITQLGVDYQLVTDYTAMIVLDDESYSDLGIEPPAGDPSDTGGYPGSPGGGYGGGYGGGSGYGGDDAGALDPTHFALFGLLALGLGGLTLGQFRRKVSWRD